MTETIYEEFDYRPPHVRAADRMIEYFRNEPVAEPTSPIDDLADRQYRKSLEPIDPLNEIASITRTLTYGQMMEFASGLGLAPQIIHRWAMAMRGL